MRLSQLVLAAGFATFIRAQEQTTVSGTTYSDCHAHGTVQWCYGPNGEETALSTGSSSATITSADPASNSASATQTGQTTAITNCHAHEADTYCVNGAGDEVLVQLETTPTGEAPAQYTDCHSHGEEAYCVDSEGNDVLVLAEGAEATEQDEHDHPLDDSSASEGQDCHFHAGVEHCVAPGESESAGAERSCEKIDRDYDIPLRIGTLFAMLVTSSIAVFLPMILEKLPFQTFNSIAFIAIKQFGTGVILATGFVHLYTHAFLMFTNPCIGEIQYEATTSAFVMAGAFISFLIEYIGHRYVLSRGAKQPDLASSSISNTPSNQESEAGKEITPVTEPATERSRGLAALGHHHGTFSPTNPNSKVSVLVMEAGVLFHSILIGITLVVAGDSFYKTLLVVIIFHQFFEGLALGARIALIPTTRLWPGKIIMGLAFALITPLGMAIGIGVLNQFNGNDSTTLWVIGTLDALSAGVLIWVALVDMWARDWVIEGGELVDAGAVTVGIGLFSLVAGMVLMSFLGKWA